ncbi:hypothetical protein TRSC58_04331 [Trypanosoma rangeli SC58]|uniref:Uncharacterized protein n=1 Tax=Trypanosoma rangeli SC58 TaxID=429131 RepID=A0A061IZ70_TRYRA|nr:hypothetical protein TRSC58_04331 [Trypanosoma rangeli SC58]
MCFSCVKEEDCCMASTEVSLRLKSPSFDTAPPSLIERQQPSCAGPSAPFQLLRQLRAHVAVRVMDAGNYSDPSVPASLLPAKKSPKFSLGRSLLSVTSCLVSKVVPSPEERYVTIEEAEAHTVTFVVRHLLKGVGTGEAAQELGDIIVRYPLTMLVDVSTFFVPEKNAFTFKLFSGTFHSTYVMESSRGMNNTDLGVTFPPTSSSCVSASGEVGLKLIFKETLAAFPLAKDIFRKVEMWFVSPRERDLWLHCLERFYATSLLDSVRTGGGFCLCDSEMRRLTEESARLMRQKPAPAVIERYIDFFLSSVSREDADRAQEVEVVDPRDVPCGGILRIDLGDNHFETRRFAYKKNKRRSASAGHTSGEEEEYLVMHPTTVSQRVRRVAKYKVPIGQLRVMVEEEHFGHAFFLEQTAEVTSGCPRSLLSLFQSQPSNTQLAWAASPSESSNDFVVTETIELHASGFLNRIRWLKWFEVVLRKPVIYLSRLREEKKSLEKIHGPRRRCTSFFLESLPPAFAGDV